MLAAHYSGKINIRDYWSLGDSRTISLSSMGKSTPMQVQPAQTSELVIIGFNHDTLETPINGKPKSAMTVQVKNCLSGSGGFNTTGRYDSGLIWSSSSAYYWCNQLFTSMLPSDISGLIKPVNKISNRYSGQSDYAHYKKQETSTDKVFFLSMYETFGEKVLDETYWGNLGTLDPDGTQYEYMKIQSNRIKEGPTNSENNPWMLRTCFLTNSSTYKVVSVSPDGDEAESSATSTTNGISPAFCL